MKRYINRLTILAICLLTVGSVFPALAQTWVQEFTIDYSGLGNTTSGAANAAGTGLTDLSASGVMVYNRTAAGVGYVTAPAVALSGGGSPTRAASGQLASISAGTVSQIAAGDPGSGYSSAPTVVLSGGGFSTPATFTSTLGCYFINGGVLKSQGLIAYPLYNYAYRTAPTVQQRVKINFTMTTTATNVVAVLRGNTATLQHYFVYVSQTQLYVFYANNGVKTTLSNGGAAITLTGVGSTDSMTLDCNAVPGTSGTNIGVTLTDNTTLATVYSGTPVVNDNSIGVQAAGVYGIAAGTSRANINSAVFYSQSGFSAAPGSVPLNNATQTITLTSAGETWVAGTPGTPTITLTNSGGTTAAIISQVVTDASHCNVVLSTGGTAGTVTLGETGTGATGATTTLILAPEAVANMTASSITTTRVTITVPAATYAIGNVSYALYRYTTSGTSPPSGATLISTQSGISNGVAPANFSDTPPVTFPATVYYYKVLATDSQSQAVLSPQLPVVLYTAPGLFNIGFIGDSITNGSSGAVIMVNWVNTVAVVTGGTGYTGATVVTISAPSSGITATAIPVISGGIIQRIYIVNHGSGYTGTSATVTITDSGGGTGATATAAVGGGACLACQRYLSAGNGLRNVSVVDVGISGQTSGGWAPNNAIYLNAISSFVDSTTTPYVMVQLGTNDAKVASQVSKATYKSNISSILTDLMGRGFVSILNDAPFINTFLFAQPQWDDTSNARLQEYSAALDELVASFAATNPGKVIRGTKSPFAYWINHPEESSDGVHPNDVGYNSLGRFWSYILEPILAITGPVTRGRSLE